MSDVKTFLKRLTYLSFGGKIATIIGLTALVTLFFWQALLGDAKEVAVVSQFDKNAEKWTTVKGGDVRYNEINGNFDGHIESSIERNFVPLDLVLAIDNTASMRNTINAIKVKARELIERLKEKNPSFRIGILNITDLDYEKEITYSDLSSNIEMQLSFLDTLGLTSGGNGDPSEDVYASLVKSLDFDWRDKEGGEEVLKIIVVITDNPPKNRELSVKDVAKNIRSLDNSFLLPIVTSNRANAITELFDFAEQVNSVNQLKHRKVTLNNIKELLLQEINLTWKTNNPWYWKAPKKYRTDWRPAYNQYITYSIKAENSGNPFDHKEDIKIVGKKGQTLTYDIEEIPRSNWTNYKIPLNEMAGWILKDSIRAPTTEEFINILSDIEDFQIRGDYYLESGTCLLDNVSLIGVPADETPVPLDIKFVRANTGYSKDKGIEWVSTGEKIRIQVEYSDIVGSPLSIPLSYDSQTKIQVPIYRTIHNPRVFLSDPILVSHGDEGKLDPYEIHLRPTGSVRSIVPGGLTIAEIARYPFTVHVSKPFGFVSEEVNAIEVDSPILPRFFVSSYGDISVDVATEEKQNLRDAVLRIYQKSENAEDTPVERYSQSIHPYLINMNPNPNSKGRWVTLNLNSIIIGMLENRMGVFDLKDVFLRLTLVGRSGEKDYFSPLLDRYKQLENLRIKAESLSRELTGKPLSEYLHKHDDDIVIGRSWYWFTEKAKTNTRVTFKNLYKNGYDRDFDLDEIFELYAIEKDSIRLLQEINFQARANEQDVEFIFLDPVNWSDEQIKNFVGLQLVLKEASKRLLEDGVQGSTSSIKKFRFEPLLSSNIAAILINDIVEEEEYYDSYKNAAEEFLGRIPINKGEQAALDKAREWQTKIKDFLVCLEKLDDAFEEDELFDLFNLLSKESDNTTFHIGHPREDEIAYSRNTGPQGFELNEEFDLGKTSSEIFLRGLASFGTTGRAAGDLPDAAKEVLEREVERRVLAQNAYRASYWKTPSYFPKHLYEVDPKDAEAFMEIMNGATSIYLLEDKSKKKNKPNNPNETNIDKTRSEDQLIEDDGKPKRPLGRLKNLIDRAKGEYFETMGIKLDVDERLKEHKVQGRDVIFIPGYLLITQDGNPPKKNNQKIMDGVIVEIKDDKFHIHEVYEFKSGNDVKGGINQIAGIRGVEGSHHSSMVEFGLRVKKPSRPIINYFESKGMGHLLKEATIGEKNTPVIDLPKDAVNIISKKRNRILVLARDAPLSSEYEHEYTFEVIRSTTTKKQIEDFTIKLLEYHGIGPDSWERVDYNILQYWDHYQILIRKGFAAPMDRIDVEQKFLLGERFDPIKKQWVDIFDRDDGLRGSNPLTPWRLYYPYVKALNKGETGQDYEEKTRGEFFNEGYRFTLDENGDLRDYQPPHIYTPHNASIAEMERIYLANELISGNIQRGEESLALMEFQKQVENGKVYDWRDLKFIDREYPKEWEEIERTRFNELLKRSPEEARQIRLTQVKSVSSDMAASAIQALNAGFLEASRVANQKLKVLVRRMPGSRHTFIIAQRIEMRGDQIRPVTHIDSPIRQKLNLILWFERGNGLFSGYGIPQWLSEAEADGNQMDWYGNN